MKLELYSPNSSGESSKRDRILSISPKGGTHHAIEEPPNRIQRNKIHELIQTISKDLTNFNQIPISNNQNTSDIMKVLSTSTEASTLIPLRCPDLQSSNSAGPTLIYQNLEKTYILLLGRWFFTLNGPWNTAVWTTLFIFPTKYVIPKSLKFSHWPSKGLYYRRKQTNLPDFTPTQIMK